MADISYTVKSLFFDRQVVIDATDQQTRAALNRSGARIRMIARRSMRVRKGPSRPGTPPNTHARQLRDLLYYSFEPHASSVVIGPVPFGKGIVPHLMEKGGTEEVERTKWSTVNGQRHSTKLTVTAKYPPRPFMGPALKIEAPNILSGYGYVSD